MIEYDANTMVQLYFLSKARDNLERDFSKHIFPSVFSKLKSCTFSAPLSHLVWKVNLKENLSSSIAYYMYYFLRRKF